MVAAWDQPCNVVRLRTPFPKSAHTRESELRVISYACLKISTLGATLGGLGGGRNVGWGGQEAGATLGGEGRRRAQMARKAMQSIAKMGGCRA
jgi:hypothetical protein